MDPVGHSICKATDQSWIASTVLKIFLIVCQKIYGSRDPGLDPFRGTLFVRSLGIHKANYVPNVNSLTLIDLKIFYSNFLLVIII